jgi:hypothetical protein
MLEQGFAAAIWSTTMFEGLDDELAALFIYSAGGNTSETPRSLSIAGTHLYTRICAVCTGRNNPKAGNLKSGVIDSE